MMTEDRPWRPLPKNEHLDALRQRDMQDDEVVSDLRPLGIDSHLGWRSYGGDDGYSTPQASSSLDMHIASTDHCRVLVGTFGRGTTLSDDEIADLVQEVDRDEHRPIDWYLLSLDGTTKAASPDEFALGDADPEDRDRQLRIIDNFGFDYLLLPRGVARPAGIDELIVDIWYDDERAAGTAPARRPRIA